MVRRYQFGNPINTEAVVKTILLEQGTVPYLEVSSNGNLSFHYTMEKSDVIYGLGENTRGINKRGWIYTSNCADDFSHTEDKKSLYGAHNFLVVQGTNPFGVFVDYAGVITFDIGYHHIDEMVIMPEDKNFNLYIIDGDSVLSIIKQFRGLVGRSYIPPKWGMGFGQCRWSYMSAKEIMEVADGYRDHHIPIDSIYLDIDYMERYKDFTINNETFPDFPEFVKAMKKRGIRLVPIIDAGVKIEVGYDVYEEGKKGNYFCKDKFGKDFVAGVWPGRVHFPDFLNKDARHWFGNQYKVLLDAGIEGFWNDMNEPAIFYSEDHLQEVFEKMEDYKGKNLDIQSFFEMKSMIGDMSNNSEDYKRFYHNKDGEIICHDKVHNLYGYNMTRAAGEAFEELEPAKRLLMFSRSSCIGMHRYGGIWTGDNQSWWSHILLSIKQMIGLNMCGFLYTGADIGGFGSNTTEDLVLRWTEFGIFTPLMRNHAAMGTRNQEAYSFSNTENFKNIIGLRYFFLPYLYSEYMRAALNDEMYFMPMSFLFPEDAMAIQVEDQLFIGNGLMIAPVYTQNATGRYVYLPERMKMYRLHSKDDISCVIYEEGHHYINIFLNEIVVFVRSNHMIPCSIQGAEYTDEMDDTQVVMLDYVTSHAKYTLYRDNGYDKDYENPENYTTIMMDATGEVTVKGNKKLIVKRVID